MSLSIEKVCLGLQNAPQSCSDLWNPACIRRTDYTIEAKNEKAYKSNILLITSIYAEIANHTQVDTRNTSGGNAAYLWRPGMGARVHPAEEQAGRASLPAPQSAA
ncbi:hypothetical protein ACT6QH_05415 [Xanthobacter sp. TB0139]|uniref:hypothetical protein n=1 Tax=Xanthobacter sp. TB0139 TaxID=3459178 RepID=UPI0040391C14